MAMMASQVANKQVDKTFNPHFKLLIHHKYQNPTLIWFDPNSLSAVISSNKGDGPAFYIRFKNSATWFADEEFCDYMNVTNCLHEQEMIISLNHFRNKEMNVYLNTSIPKIYEL